MEPIEIRVDSKPYSRRRRPSGLGQNLVRIIFFVVTLIPTCIIAWRIDLVNPRQQTVVVQQRHDAVKQPAHQSRSISTQQSRTPKRLERSPDVLPVKLEPEMPIGDVPDRPIQIIGQPDPIPAQPMIVVDRKPSAIVPLTFEKSVVRVIAIADNFPVESLMCDIGLSPNITDATGFEASNHVIVAERLLHRGKYTAELNVRASGYGAAIEFTVLRKNNAAICELRPKFSLPSGDIEQLTIARGSRLHSRLIQLIKDSAAAKRDLPGMQETLRRMGVDRQVLQRMTNANGPNAATTAAGRSGAMARLVGLNRDINRLSQQIDKAQALIADAPAMQIELAALKRISEYARSIAAVGTVYVRFYSGNVTVPATIK